MYKNLNLFNKPVQRTYHVAGTILYTFKILIYLSSQQLHKLGTIISLISFIMPILYMAKLRLRELSNFAKVTQLRSRI